MNLICKPSRIQVSKLENIDFIGKKYRDCGVWWFNCIVVKAQRMAHFLEGIIDEHPGFDIIVAVIEEFLETGVTNAERVILAELTKKKMSNENSICPNRLSYYKTKIATLELQLNSEMGTPSVTIQTI